MQKSEWYGGILNLSAALYSYYGLETGRQPDPDLAFWLETNHFRCVTVLLLDGLGTSILEKAGSVNGWFRSHMHKSVTTVFPPTTTAATTSFLTGRSPKENAWLGWNQYFREKDDQIILFREMSQYTPAVYPGFVQQALPVKWIMDALKEKGIKADSVWPAFGYSHPSRTFEEFCDNVLAASSDPDTRFVYGYWDNPDDWLHEHGPSDPGLPALIGEMENAVRQLADRLPEDTGLMIIADHSQIDVEHYALDQDLEICECLASRPSLEPRAAGFFIREGKKEQFAKLFGERFKDSFLLLSHDEVISSGLFGTGIAHERFEEFIGDYLAIALTPVQFDYLKGSDMRGNHAGGMEEEALIPLILDQRL